MPRARAPRLLPPADAVPGRLGLTALLLIATALPAPAAERAAARARPTLVCPEASEAVTVADILAGDTVRLADGRRIALAGVEVPRRLGRDAASADAPREAAARDALAAHLNGAVRLATLGPADRRSALPGRLVTAAGDAAETLLAAGHLRLRPAPGAKPCLATLRAAETVARSQRLGLWATDEFRLRTGDDTDLPRLADSYAVVEGRVVSTGRAGQRRYIDFGRNHRTDFTVVIDARKSAQFAAEGFDIDRLRGRRIRVRGWLTAHDGAEMVIEAPEEMEWVDEETQPAPAALGSAAPG